MTSKNIRTSFSASLASMLLVFACLSNSVNAQTSSPLSADAAPSSNAILVADDGIHFAILDSPPNPPKGMPRPVLVHASRSTVILPGVPTSEWTYGCAATAAGMLFGYYDRAGYPNMYTGPTNGGVAPLFGLGQGIDPSNPIAGACSIIATQNGFDGRTEAGHVDDYWLGMNSAGPDPWESGGIEHAWGECTADYMGTNQWKWDSGASQWNVDGATIYYYNTDGSPSYDPVPAATSGLPQTECCHGLRLFAESRGYTVTANYTQLVDTCGAADGFTFDDFVNEIDNGRPVLVHVEGHTMTGVGYDDESEEILLHDTWDNEVHLMEWGGQYVGRALRAITVLQLAPPVHTAVQYTVPYYEQYLTSWCAYSSIAMLSKYHGYSVEPWSVAAHFGHDETHGATAAEMGGYMNPLDGGISQCQLGEYINSQTHWGYDYRFWNSPFFVTWNLIIEPAIASNLDQGPFLSNFIFGNEGHAVVFTGKDEHGVYVHDPSGWLFQKAGQLITGYTPPVSNINAFISWDDLETLVLNADVYRHIRFLVGPYATSTPVSIQPPHYSYVSITRENLLALHRDDNVSRAEFHFGDQPLGYSHQHNGDVPTSDSVALLGAKVQNSTANEATVTCKLSLAGPECRELGVVDIPNLPASSGMEVRLVDNEQAFTGLPAGNYTMKWEVYHGGICTDEFQLDFMLFASSSQNVDLTINGPWATNPSEVFRISGYLTDGEVPVEGANVCATNPPSYEFGCDDTDATGQYEIQATAPETAGLYPVSVYATTNGVTYYANDFLTVVDPSAIVLSHDGPWMAIPDGAFTISGSLVNNGEPVLNKTIWAEIDGEYLGHTSTGYGGVFDLPVAAPSEDGTYNIRLYAVVDGTTIESFGVLHVSLPMNDCDYLSIADVDFYEHNGGGDGDQIPESGEEIEIDLELSTGTVVENVEAILVTSSPWVSIVDDDSSHPGFSGDSSLVDEFNVDVESCDYTIDFDVELTYEANNTFCRQTVDFSKRFLCDGATEPSFEPCGSIVINDSIDENRDGDDDGIPEGGEDFEILVSLINNGSATAIDAFVAPAPFGTNGITIETDEKHLYDVSVGTCRQIHNSWTMRTDRHISGTFSTDLIVTWEGASKQEVVEDGLTIEIVPQPWVKVLPEATNFGAAPTGEPVEISFEICNQGAAQLIVTGYEAADPDVSLPGLSFPMIVEPGTCAPVLAQIDPTLLWGPIERTIIFHSDGRMHDFDEDDRVVISGMISDGYPVFELPVELAGTPWPDVGGDKIAWAAAGINVYDLATGEERVVSTNGERPWIDDGVVAWSTTDPAYGTRDVFCYSWADGTTTQVTNDPSDERAFGVDYPYVLYARVFDTAYGHVFKNLFVYDVTTGQHQQITSYTGATTVGEANISGRMIAFTMIQKECQPGAGCSYLNEDIYHYRLPGNPLGATSQAELIYNPIDEYGEPVLDGQFGNGHSEWICWDEEDGSGQEQIRLWNNGGVQTLTPLPGADENDFYKRPRVGDNLVVYKMHQSGIGWSLVYHDCDLTAGHITSAVPTQWEVDEKVAVWGSGGEIYYTYLLEPDLALTVDGITVTPAEPMEGELFGMNVTVSNIAPLDYVGDLVITVTRFDDLSEVANAVFEGGIEGQSQRMVALDSVGPLTGGISELIVRVDKVERENPANNAAVVELTVNHPDCNYNGIPDYIDAANCGSSAWCQDCNLNGLIDACDELMLGDYNADGVLTLDDFAIFTSVMAGPAAAPNAGTPQCAEYVLQIFDTDGDGDVDLMDFGVLQELLAEAYVRDCNNNDVPDDEEIADCNGSAWCGDCDSNGILDTCDLAWGMMDDVDGDDVPDQCESALDLGEGVMVDLIHLSAGTFTMGSDLDGAAGHEQPVHSVILTEGFAVGRTEITQAQYQQVTGEAPWLGQGNVFPNCPDCAASHVSWFDAVEFCEAASVQTGQLVLLPTEAQWEYFARAETQTRFSFGDDDAILGDYAWWENNAEHGGEAYAHVVAQKIPNPWGLYDVHGNVWEWCQDWEDLAYYDTCGDPVIDPQGGDAPGTGTHRIIRGGSWLDESYQCRSSNRNGNNDTSQNSYIGLRIVVAPFVDCNSNTVDDRVDLLTGAAEDVNFNGIPDECETFVIQIGDVSIDLVPIAAGEFLMGDDSDVAAVHEQPVHTVVLTDGFSVGETEVTRAQYESVTGESPWESDSSVLQNCPDCAASHISWFDAVEFCETASTLSGRYVTLPAEAQWEYFGRARTQTRFSFGDDDNLLGDYAWWENNAEDGDEAYPHVVAQKLPNPWGIYDVHGNVWEWCLDWEDLAYYDTCGDPAIDPQGGDAPDHGTHRIIRGGSWLDESYQCRSSNRNGSDDTNEYSYIGFRIIVADLNDENGNGVDDRVEIANGTAFDCNDNGIPDECDLLDGTLHDANGDGIPDECGLLLDLGDGTTMELVRIPAGTFMMGSDNGSSNEEPVHQVTISRDFYIGKYEVTQAQYQAVVGSNPSYFDECDHCPVEYVSWNDAVAFCEAVTTSTGYEIRLPSEAEWEYACRAGTTTAFSLGDDSSELSDYAWYSSNSGSRTHEVSGKLPNAWGVYDMHGNVWEWCGDWYDSGYYDVSPPTDPMGPSTGSWSYRILRGGSWGYTSEYCRSACRGYGGPAVGNSDIGFRVIVADLLD